MQGIVLSIIRFIESRSIHRTIRLMIRHKTESMKLQHSMMVLNGHLQPVYLSRAISLFAAIFIGPENCDNKEATKGYIHKVCLFERPL